MGEPISGNDQPKRVGVRELRGNLTAFLRLVRQGRTLLVTSHDQVVAELHPPAARHRPARRPGALRGRISMDADFDRLPEDVLDAMEGGL